MAHRPVPSRTAALLLLAALACAPVLALNGCGVGSEEANAATETRVETFLIYPESFLLRSDADPTIEVHDNTTRYRLESRGTLTFEVFQTGVSRSFTLDSGEVVIERPAEGIVTLMLKNTF